MSQFNNRLSFKVTWKPFYLHGNTMPSEGMDIGDYIYKVYGMRMNVGDPNSHLNKAGRNVGINFYNQRKMVNTDDSHRLVELAKELNKEDEMVESIFHHYFEEGANISKKEELLKIGEKVLGDAITKEELESVLDGVKYQDAVDSQLKEAKGIRGVPYFVIYNPNNGRKISLSGAQPPDQFEELFESFE